MGDRGNIVVIHDDGGQVWLYSHWGGSDLPQILQTALKKSQERWRDGQYLTRIIFCTMVQPEELDGELNYGISPSMGDNERDILVVDEANQRVLQVDPATLEDGLVPRNPKSKNDWSFDLFTKLKELPTI